MSAAAGSGAEDVRNSVRVVCRFRPLNKQELAKGGGKCCISNLNTDGVQLLTGDNQSYTFSFDRIYGTNSTQTDVYEYAAAPVVESLFQGFNGCLLAYGQTGSGKTHTMMGPSTGAAVGGTSVEDDTSKGIIPRVVQELFRRALSAGSEMEFSIKVSFVEIYCERIRDLFEPKNDNLTVGEDPINGVYLKGVTEYYVTRLEEVMGLMASGNDNRATSATGMNAGSSRSHSLFIIALTQTNASTGVVTSGKLYLVDLAGSETVSKTGVSGQQLEELKKINKSLSSLGNVINALTDGKSTHIPYRDSKLTRVLQECIGGNARTTLIIACSPSVWNEMETLGTLRFGKRAKRIVNRAVVNKERSAEELKKTVGLLEAAIAILVRNSKQWIHGAESGQLAPAPLTASTTFNPPVVDLPSLVRATVAGMLVASEAMEGKASSLTDTTASPVDSVIPVVPLPLGAGETKADDSVSGVKSIDGGGDDWLDGGGLETSLSGTGEEPGARADQSYDHDRDVTGDVSGGGGRGDADPSDALPLDLDQLLSERDELLQTNSDLLELLKEAGEHIAVLKSNQSSTSTDFNQLRASLQERDERVDMLTNLLSEAQEHMRQLGATAAEASSDSTAPGSGHESALGDAEVLRSNYHKALAENEELKAELADAAKALSVLKDAAHRSRVQSGDKDTDSDSEEEVSTRTPSNGTPLASKRGGGQLAHYEGEHHDGGVVRTGSTSRLAAASTGSRSFVSVFEVAWEHQLRYPASGWSSDTSATPGYPPSWAAAGPLPANANPDSLAAADATVTQALISPDARLPSPCFDNTVSRTYRSRDDVGLPGSEWYWSKDWSIDTGQAEDSELAEVGWSYKGRDAFPTSTATPTPTSTATGEVGSPGGRSRRTSSAVSRTAPTPGTGSISRVARDGEGWQYAASWSAFGSGEPGSVHGHEVPGDTVRRRRWVRPRVRIDVLNGAEAQRHLIELATQVEVKDDLLTRMTDELTARQNKIDALEQRINALMEAMANAAATGDLTYIGQGRLGASVTVGPRGSRIVSAPSFTTNPRSIRGGGGPGGTPLTQVRSAHASPDAGGDGRGSDAGGLLGAFGSIFKRWSSPYRPSDTASAATSITARSTATPRLSGVHHDDSTRGGGGGDSARSGDASAPSQSAMQAIFDACERGNKALVDSLFATPGVSVNCEDKVGRTPFLYAARGGQLATLQYLAARGADVTASDKDGRNALHYSARRGHPDVARWLLSCGLPVSQADVHALTPLHQATLGKSYPMIKVLLENGADVNAKDANGCNALKLAQRFDEKGPENPIITLLAHYTDMSTGSSASTATTRA